MRLCKNDLWMIRDALQREERKIKLTPGLKTEAMAIIRDLERLVTHFEEHIEESGDDPSVRWQIRRIYE